MDEKAALTDLRRARRRARVAEIHWVDALYQVYLTGLGVIAAVLFLSTAVGDDTLNADQLRQVRSDGSAVLGLIAAAVLAVGLRSGCRGGPLALEAPDLRHVLMAPIRRSLVLRALGLRQLRFGLLVAAGVGAIVGQFAARRLPEATIEWVGAGALFAVVVVGGGLGAALVASGQRFPRPLGGILGVVLLAWAAADVVDVLPASPTRAFGALAIWPLEFDPVGLLAVGVALAMVVAGLSGITGLSLEAAERRTVLVGQLRFAVTLQDLRTVMVLRRQLALDLPRSRPWLTSRRVSRFPVWARGWRGVLRFSAARMLRLVILGAVAGLALRGLWGGTTPMVIPAGLALWLAGLDAVEPLAQEADHPSRGDGYPQPRGELMARHLAVPTVVSLLVALVAVAVATVGGSGLPLDVAVAAALPAALGATAGAVISVVMGVPQPFSELSVITPEIAGVRTLLRTVWPPLVAVLGVAPVLVAAQVDPGPGANPVGAEAAVAMVVVVVAVLVGAWVRFRDDIHAWWRTASEQAMGGARGESDDR